MNSKTLATIVSAMVAAISLAGCSLMRSDGEKQASFLPKIGKPEGQVVEPKWCSLTVTILAKPLHDKLVNDVVWKAAEEQAVESETRRALEANGIRVGVIEGSLPVELETALHAPPPDRVDPAEFNIPDGSNTLLAVSESASQATLLLTRDGRASGKDYKDATGWFRVTVNQSGPTGVSLRFVPEIHHGPVVHKYDAMQASAASLNPIQFTRKDGQQEETLRDLAAMLTLQPGQTAVLGANPDRPGSLGAFLFTHTEANSDRLLQKVVLVRASRSNIGIPGSQPKDHPRLMPVDPPELPPLSRRGS
jgi:hypothetical protein